MRENRLSPLLQRLERLFTLTQEERHAVEKLPVQVTNIKRGQDLVRESDRPSRSTMLMTGHAYWYKLTGTGVRQIIAIQMPGEIPDLQTLFLPRLDCTLVTLTEAEVAFVPHEHLRHLIETYPRIAAALWRACLIDAAMFREWVVNVGGRKADARLAHLLCEFAWRARDLGLMEDDTCLLPLNQTEMADATGLSVVHVNRTLQDLRGEKLITLKAHKLTVLDWERLAALGDFEPDYLFLDSEYRAPFGGSHPQ